MLLLFYTDLNFDDLSNVFQRYIYVNLVGYLREHPHRKKRARNVKVICWLGRLFFSYGSGKEATLAFLNGLMFWWKRRKE